MKRARWGLGVLVAALALATPATADAPSGPRLAFVSFDAESEPSELGVFSVDASGQDLRTLFVGSDREPFGAPAPLQRPAWSPDGSQIAYSGFTGLKGKSRIFVMAADGAGLRVLPGTQGASEPVFSPDGRLLAFARTRFHAPPIDSDHPLKSLRRGGFAGATTWVLDLASGKQRRLTEWRDGLYNWPSSFSPNGSTLALSRATRPGPAAVALPLAGGRPRILARRASEPVYSPDGSRIAFVSYRDGNLTTDEFDEPALASELYVKSVSGGALHRLTNTPERQESAPSWDPSGERIAYIQNTRSESSPYGFSNVVMATNADGSCQKRVFGQPSPKPGRDYSLYAPAWQPGPGREVGRIEC